LCSSSKVGIIILAAGESSRLGEPKQLKKFRGKRLLQLIIDCCNDFDYLAKILVLGANVEIITKEIDTKHFVTIRNKNWSLGIGTSIAVGIEKALLIEPDLEHVLILLSDQPFVTQELIDKLLRVHLNGDKDITACLYKNIKGVPAIFSKAIFNALKSLNGDKGAGKIIALHHINTVNFEEGIIDIDTPDDYQKLITIEDERWK
jgi:molybdenum cofactor cytidylyltransferase